MSGSYTLWIYYPRLNGDSLYTALNKYVKPKIDDTEKLLRRIESELPNATGREASSLRTAFEETEVFLDELREYEMSSRGLLTFRTSQISMMAF